MHPIVELLKPSSEQRPAIESRGQDVVVTAGAGTGKTLTLVARYLSLVAQTNDLRSIVAITFTRKAAREMRNRVREAIRQYLLSPDLAPAERERWQSIYSALDAARIGTIHSLCTEILRGHPAEAGVDPRFEVLEQGVSGVLTARAIDEALAWAANDAQAAALFSLRGEKELRKDVTALLGKRLSARENLSRLPVDLTAHWRETAGRLDPGAELNPLDDLAASAVPLLRATFEKAVQRLEGFKAERRALDYADLEGRALLLLRDHPAVLAYWHSVLSAILMDEFQDTNARQYRLVELLCSSPGKLFVVGDAKQSIYRFQGADVAVFRQKRAHIGATGGLTVSLSTSYRAHQALVEGLNNLLRPVLGAVADPTRPHVEPFAELKHHRTAPGRGFAPPHIELHLALGTKAAGALVYAARCLAARIRELVESGVTVGEGERARPLTYGDVAILCRASTSFAPYEDALNEAGLPYLTVAGRGFWDRPEIRDLLNTLLALADPTDDLALAGLLRSPAIGLSDAALYRLVRTRGESPTLWSLLQASELWPALEPPEQAALRRAVDLVTDLHSRVGRTTVANVLKAWLDASDYRAALRLAGNSRGVRNLDKLLAAAHTSGIVGVGEFLEYVQELKDSGAREGEARATVEGAVQIMSVHQAKGLEFPVVAVGDLGYANRGRDTVLLDDDLLLTLPLRGEDKDKPVSYELARALDTDREDAESNRLFYVACTRAREKLLLSGCFDTKKDGSPTRLCGWLATVMGPDLLNLADKPVPLPGAGEAVLKLDRTVGTTPIGCTIYLPQPGKLEELPSAEDAALLPTREVPPATPAIAPPLLTTPVPLAEHLDQRQAESERIPARRVWRVVPAATRPTAPAWVLGSLVHEALAAMGGRPASAGPAASDESFERWARSRARSYGLADEAQLADAVRRSARLLQRFRAHPLYQEMNTADLLLHEVPYHMQTEGRVESGIIDALYRRGDSWTLVEFKTDELRGQDDLLRVLASEDYTMQSRTYVRAMQRLLGVSPRAILCFLNVAGAVRLYEPPGL